MKKIFTLIAVAMMAVGANAQVIFSWESTSSEAATVTGGSAEYKCGDGTNRVNYANSPDAGTTTYYTICLAGKKANMGGDVDEKGNTGYVLITLDKEIAAGDKIIMTAYYNKGEDKEVSAYIKFENGADFSTTAGDFPDIKDGRQATTPKEMTYVIPEGAAGSKTIQMTRDKAGTNLFITKFVISRGGSDGIKNVTSTASAAKVVKCIENGQLVIKAAKGTFNVAGARIK